MRPRYPHHPFALIASLLPATFLAAQDPRPLALDPTELRVPIHDSMDPADPGRWAAAASWKASFHDGFEFHPVLGEGYPHNLPLRWTTLAVRAGGALVELPENARHESSAWRYEYVHDGVRESYDVRADGVAQSFRIAERPARRGDLAVVGRITTELRCAPLAAAHQALVFSDDHGTPIVRYGEAFAFDADGRTTTVTTAWDGELATLTVPADWLLDAAFPVTIDPLTSALTLSSGALAIRSCDVGEHGESTSRNVLFAFDRTNSATDRDTFAFLCNQDYGSAVAIMSSLSTTHDDRDVSVAFVAGADRWLVGYLRNGYLRVYFHDRTITALNRGLAVDGTFPFYAVRSLDLGGTYPGSTGVRGLCVYQADPLDGRPSQVGTLPIDAATRTLEFNDGTNLGAAPFDSYDRERPSVNQVAGNSRGNDDGWLVVYQEQTLNTSNTWRLQGHRTDTLGTSVSAAVHLSPGTDVRVSGVSGYYTMTYLDGSSLKSRRVVWAPGQALPTTRGTENTIAISVPPLTVLSNQGLAVNHEISTTAVATWTVTRTGIGSPATTSGYAARLTSAGAVVETETLHSASGSRVVSPAVTFSLPGQAYQIVYGVDDGTVRNVVGRRYTYPADAIEVLYGTGCGSMTIDGHRPYLGNGHYQVSGVAGPVNVPATLLIGLGPSAVPLDPIGMLGCTLNVDQVTSLSGTTDAAGRVTFPLPLPESVLEAYDLYFQIAYLNPGSNPAGVQATRGLKAQVR